jgi:hypothetical protein
VFQQGGFGPGAEKFTQDEGGAVGATVVHEEELPAILWVFSDQTA